MLKITPSATAPETKLTFSLPLDHPAGQVSVVGNFNDWTPGVHRLVKRNNGTMSVTVTVPADYIANFRYLGENGEWFDEPDADRIDSGASTVWAREASPLQATRAVSDAVGSAAHAVAETVETVVTTARRKAKAAGKTSQKTSQKAADTKATAKKKAKQTVAATKDKAAAAADKASEKAGQKVKQVKQVKDAATKTSKRA